MKMPKKLITITLRDQNALLQSLKWIKENCSLSEDGSIKMNLGIQYFIVTEILTRNTIAPSIPKGIHRRAVNLALQEWLKNSTPCDDDAMLAAFICTLELEINRLKTNQQLFSVLMFLNVDESIHNLEPISILGEEVVIKAWNDLSTLRTEDLYKETALNHPSNPFFTLLNNKRTPRSWDFMPVIFTTKSYVARDAVRIAEDRFDILRAILNLSGLSEYMTYYRSEPKQYSIFLPTPVLGVFDTQGNLLEPFRTTEKYDHADYSKSTLKNTWLSSARRLLPLFEREVNSSSVKHHILGLLRLYQQTIDTSSAAPAFLGMWQVLESAVTFGSENIKNQEIASRVSTLVGLSPLYSSCVKLFTEMRNNYVHNGNFDPDGYDLFPTLKLIAETCIFRLLDLVKEFNTVQELRDYLKYCPLGNDELARKINVIESIQKTRAPRSCHKL